MAIRPTPPPREPRFDPCATPSPLLLVCLIGFTLFVVGFVVGRLTR
jgi:hypothetical protein